MKNSMHFAGAKPTIERVVRSYERGRPRIVVEFDPATRMVRSTRVEIASGTDRMSGECSSDWPIVGIPTSTVGIDEFRRTLAEAVALYGRSPRWRQAATQAERAHSDRRVERLTAELDVFVVSRPRSGRA